MTVEELQIVIKANVEDALRGIKTVTDAVKQATQQSIAPMQKITAQAKQIGSQTAVAMQQAKSSIKGLGSAISSTTAQQQLLLNKINDLKATLSFADQDPKLFSKTEILQMRAEVEKLEKQLYKMQNTSNNTGNNLSKAFENGAKSVKRFLFNMFSVGSIFALVARSMRSFLDTNDEASASYELITNVLGQMLAPAMGIILNLVQYLAIGIALLIKMFTGFDVLAKVTTKNIKNATSATKKLNKELTAMDEITNLSGQDAGLSGLSGIQADLTALEKFQEKIGQVQKLFEDWNIQGIVDKLKEMADWLWENKEVIGLVGTSLGLTFGAIKIAGIVDNIKTLIGVAGVGGAAGTGMAGIVGLLKFLGTIGFIAISVGLIYNAVTGRNILDDLGTINQAIKENGGYWESWKKGIDIIFGGVTKTIGNFITKVKNFFGQLLGNFSIGGGFSGGGGSSGARFATGGVVKQPTYGLMGEYANASSNPEIIAPQSIMRETLQQALAPYMSMLSSGGNNRPIVLNVNGREFAKATYQDFQSEGYRNGNTTNARRVA